jgi:U3 small nucleolar RNA-associated protein 21
MIKSVCISVCGNYGFIGSALGRIDKYNMQSGLYRSSMIGHSKAITFIVSDNINQFVISASLDGTIKFWDFNKGDLKFSLDMKSSITHLSLHNDSRLLGVVTDDMMIRVIDIDTFKTVRVFAGHTNRITDFCFSNDGRWIVSSSLDTTIRTWDLPTGFMIDVFRVLDICTSLSMSASGDFIATTHVNSVGIYLWSNRSQYTHVPLRQLVEEDVKTIILPTTSGVNDEDVQEDTEVDQASYEMLLDQPAIPDNDFISLSNLPKSRWQNLLNLDSIKERNKPMKKEAPKTELPFFLPTVAGAIPTFAPEAQVFEDSRVQNMSLMDVNSRLVVLLNECNLSPSQDYSPVLKHLKSLQPSAIDLEIRTLPQDAQLARFFLDAIEQGIKTRTDFELVLSYLCCFIKVIKTT